LLDLAATEITSNNAYYLKEKIIYLQKQHAWIAAERTILNSQIDFQHKNETQLLLATNYLYSKRYKKTKQLLNTLVLQTEAEKLLAAEICYDLAMNIYIDKIDKDGNTALKKPVIQLLQRARGFLEGITFTKENEQVLIEKLTNIEKMLQKDK
jgi:hypothetical protein